MLAQVERTDEQQLAIAAFNQPQGSPGLDWVAGRVAGLMTAFGTTSRRRWRLAPLSQAAFLPRLTLDEWMITGLVPGAESRFEQQSE